MSIGRLFNIKMMLSVRYFVIVCSSLIDKIRKEQNQCFCDFNVTLFKRKECKNIINRKVYQK